MTARLARSDPQASKINKGRQTPNKKSGERSEHLIGVCGAQRWLRLSKASASFAFALRTVWGDEVAPGEEGE